MQYGSLSNILIDRVISENIEIGVGATVLHWSDRNAATVVDVIRFKSGARKGEISGVYVTWDKATRTDTNGQSDAQSYEYETDWDGHRVRFNRCKDGRFIQAGGGNTLRIGYRETYYDYSF
jgi:hypothetical protein